MKVKTGSLAILLSANSIYVNAQCLTSFNITADHCSYDSLVISIQNELENDPLCLDKDAVVEIEDLFGTEAQAKILVHEACRAAYIPFGAITNQGSVFDKEYYDGGTYYNGGRESVNEYGIVTNRLETNPGDRIEQIYRDLAQSQGFTWPDHLPNFEENKCKFNAAMCCFTQDRQAGDNNGNCDSPYDEECADADPADNTDICYVDMERAPTSSRTRQGYAIFQRNEEEDSHCHGFAWAEDSSDTSARFKANKLFFVSMYDHLAQRGYVRSVPGAPMCACIEQMPVVTRADCTQVDIESETAEFSFDGENGLIAAITDLEIEFNACQGANNNSNDLSAYYQRLVDEEKISSDKQDIFKQTVVGETYCPEAIDSFFNEKGLVPKPECEYGNRYECGCPESLQKDYRGTINVTTSGLQCQRWDEQSPHQHRYTRERYPEAGLVENYCRNPSDSEGGAWCYTTNENTRWEFCDVPVCGEEQSEIYTCSYEEDQSDYLGTISVTEDGYTCQAWDAQSPQSHRYKPTRYLTDGLRSNYCRNPSSGDRTWCYTTDPDVRWRYCDVPRCNDEGVELSGITVSEASMKNPTSSSESMPKVGLTCIDSPLDVFVSGGNVGCSIIASNPNYCSFPGAGSHCPFTCNKCSEYQCADSELEFVYNNESYNCSVLQLVNEIERKKYCSFEEVYSTCRASCEFCS